MTSETSLLRLADDILGGGPNVRKRMGYVVYLHYKFNFDQVFFITRHLRRNFENKKLILENPRRELRFCEEKSRNYFTLVQGYSFRFTTIL